MKPKHIIYKLSLFLSLFFLTLIFKKSDFFVFSAPKLNVSDISLHMNEAYALNLSDLPKGARLQFHSKDNKVCTVSSKGIILGLTPGKTEVIVNVLNKKGKKRFGLKTTVHVDHIFLATSNKDLAKAHVSQKAQTVLLKPKKGGVFSLPKGSLGYGLNVESKKDITITINEDTILRELTLTKAPKLKLKIKGSLPLLTLRSEGTKAQVEVGGKKGLLSAFVVDSESTIAFSSSSTKKDEHGTKIYLSQKSHLHLSGKQTSPISVFVWKDAVESDILTKTPIQYFSHVSSTLTLNKGAEASSITTLDYKVSVIVDNKTDRELTINTPSVIKTIPKQTRKTINGK